VEEYMDEERRLSHQYGGRWIGGWSRKPGT
jgi:hypothetical protein